MLNHKQMIIDLFKHCKLTILMDGSEDLLMHSLKPNQTYEADIDQLKGLYYVVLQERQDLFWDFFWSDTFICYNKTDHIWPQFGKN